MKRKNTLQNENLVNKIKSAFIACFVFVAAINTTNAQITPGSYTIGVDYPSISAAITALNTNSITGTGTVAIEIPAGYTETVTAGGFTLTCSGVAGSPIIFRKNGPGVNPILYAYTGGTGTPGSLFQDGVWRLVGADYITIDGIDIMDPNTTNPSTMEFGYCLIKANAGDGCQFNTIKNCVITLNRANNASGTAPAVDGSRGIDVVNALTTAHNAVATPTSVSGSNSNNMFTGNIIQNCNIGIALIGFAASSPYSLADVNNMVTGNAVINFGGGGTTSPAAAIRTLAQYDLLISNNLVNNNNGSGVNHATTLRGIYMNTAASANASIVNNTVTVNSGATTSQLAAIENVAGSAGTTNTINISGNLITSCTYSGTTSGIFNGIYNNGATPAFLTIDNNIITGLTLNSANSTGSVGLIFSAATIGNGLSITSNTIQNIGPLNTTGSIVCINNSNSTNNYTVQNNYVNNVTRGTGPTTGGMSGYYNNSSPTGGTAYVVNNIFTNLTGGVGGTSTYGINFTPTTSQTCIVTGNTITAVTSGSTIANGILHTYGAAGSLVGNNTISNINATGPVNGIVVTGGNAPLGLTISSNTITGLMTTGAFSAVGINYSTGVNTMIRKNKIYDITSNNAAGTAYGINIGSFGSGNTLNVQNNHIGDIKAPSTSNPANAVVGINIPSVSSTSQIHIYYNTIYINAASSGANFGTTGLLHTTSATSTTGQLFLRNNIIINNSTPNGTGIVAAYRRSNATLSNFNTASNNNNFYVTAGPSNYLYYDGANMFTTLSTYQAFVTPRDANSISENTSFLSTSGPSANFLHVDPTVPSLTESGAVNIAGITDDYDNDIRQGNPGYAGSGTAPDIGADEYNQALPACTTVTAAAISAASLMRCNGQTAMMNATGYTSGTGIEYQWQVSSSMSGPFSNVIGGSGATTTSYTTAALTTNVYYYQFVTTCTLSAATATSNVISVTVNPVPTASATSNSPLCSGQTLNLTGSSDVGTNFVWTGPSTYSVQNPSVVATSSLSGTYTLIVSAAGCTATPVSVTVTITTTPSALTVTPTSTTLCAGNSQTITALGGDIDKTMAFGTQANQNTASTTSAGYPAPYTVYYGGQRMQILILASELSAAGFTVNSSITSVQFPVVSKGANWGTTLMDCKSFRVNMGTTTLTSLTSFQSGLTNVAPPMSFTPTVGYNNVHSFSTPFIWDGVSNVILESSFSNNILGATGDLVVQYNSPTTFNSCVVAKGDNATPAAMSSTTTSNHTYMARPDFKLNGTAPGSYLWSPSLTLSSATSATTIATPTASTDYTLTATNGACSASAVSSITVNPLPTVSVSATPTAICAGASVSLTAIGATTYSWSTGGTTSTISDTPSSTATYTVDGTNSCGTDTKTISVTVNSNPTVAAVSSSSAVCAGSSATLTATGANTYSWTSAGSGSSIVVTPTANTTYTVEGTDVNGCIDIQMVSVNYNSLPTVIAASSSSAVCAGTSATLTASGADTYSWTSVGTGSMIVVTPTANTTYTVEGTDVNGCMDLQMVSVNTNSLPVMSANTSASVLCVGSSATLTANGANTYSWTSVGAGASIVVSPTTTTTYTVEGTDVNGCTDTISIQQIVSNCTGINASVINEGIHIYPNPSNGLITLQVSDVTKQMQFEVYDAMGKNVLRTVINSNETQINMSELANGVYSYRLVNVNGLVSQGKLIKQ